MESVVVSGGKALLIFNLGKRTAAVEGVLTDGNRARRLGVVHLVGKLLQYYFLEIYASRESLFAHDGAF